MAKGYTIPATRSKPSLSEKLRRLFIVEKLNNPFGIALLIIICTAITFAIVKFGMMAAFATCAVMIGIPVVYGIVAYPRFGIVIFFTLGYLIMWFYKMGVEFPIGTLMDGMEGLFILSLFIRQRKKKDWSMFKGPVTTMILLWVGYNLVEVANPTAESRLAWVYAIRTVAVIMFMYFIFLYYVNTVAFIKIIFKLWIALATFGALYALKQQYIGFFPFEEEYLHADPSIALLLFIGGVWRKFSIFSDPVCFAYNMVTAALLCIGLMTGPMKSWKRLTLGALVALFMLAMLYSGTRGAFVLVPFTMLLFVVMKYNKLMLVFLVIGVVVMATLIFMPTGNQTLARFQTAFKPSDDASFTLRKINQKRIQPFMQTHPLGGGLGAVGEWGARFSPGTLLGTFQPDSGYVRVAVELGSIGLALFCTLMFVILRTGINNFYKIKDPRLKSYCLAVTLVVFGLNFGNYPQEALMQYPSNVIFYLTISLMTTTLTLDQKKKFGADGGE